MARWDLEPTVGRMVHYVPKQRLEPDSFAICQAAVVASVNGSDATLTVMPGMGVYHVSDVPHDETLQQTDGMRDHVMGTWHWPEMVNTGFSMKVTGVIDGNSPSGPGK